MSNSSCPPDEDLLPAVVGETLTADVNGHLQTCTACQNRVGMLSGDLKALRSLPMNKPTAAGPARPKRPTTVGKYLVVGELDSGGQAHVYRALHPLLDKELVIKLSRKPVDPQSDHRHLLVAEGKLLARLEHPNLVQVVDLDFHDDLPFLAMEYVRGQNLYDSCGGKALPPRRAAEVVAELARALVVVHRHGILHQDVKPHNILIDENDRPRLIDFGLARIRKAWEGSDQPSGGTPAFMAPEQARGDEAAIGPRSDIFALGSVLYFLLTARAPFAAEDVNTALKRAENCDFDREALTRAGVDRRLRAICLRAMAARPDDRYARAADLAEDLERYLAGSGKLVRTVGGVVAAVLVLGALIAGIVWFRPGPTPQHPPGDVADLQVQVSRGDKYLDLPAALPLNPAVDKVQIVGKVAPGHHGVLLHVNTKGKVKPLEAVASPADTFTRLVFPGAGGQASFDPDTTGTEFVLLCAAEKAEMLDGLEELVGSVVGQLPSLPPKVLVWLSKDEPKRQTSSFGSREPDPVAGTEMKLDALRRRLVEKRVTAIRGVAFSR